MNCPKFVLLRRWRGEGATQHLFSTHTALGSYSRAVPRSMGPPPMAFYTTRCHARSGTARPASGHIYARVGTDRTASRLGHLTPLSRARAGLPVPRRAHLSRGGHVCPEAGLSSPRRTYLTPVLCKVPAAIHIRPVSPDRGCIPRPVAGLFYTSHVFGRTGVPRP